MHVSEVMYGVVGLLGSGIMLVGVILIRPIFLSINRTEKKLQENEAKLFKFLETLPVGVFIANKNGNPYYANGIATEILGKGISQDTNKEQLADFYQAYVLGTDEKYPNHKMPLIRALSGVSSKIEDMEIRKPDGSIVLEVVGIPVCNETGSLQYAIATFSDITDRRKLEGEREGIVSSLKEAIGALQRTEAQLTEAQRLARIGSWYWDAKTGVSTGSDELLRIYGLDPATQRMPSFREQQGHLYPVEEWQRLDAAVQKTLETGVGYELDVQAIRDGATIWVTSRSEIVRDADGQIVGLQGTVQDITERKRMGESLKGQADQLELANKELESFTYSVSHDLRAPLRAIDGFSRILIRDMNDKLNDEERRKFNVIRDNAHRMSRLIDDLLAFSRSSRQTMSSSVVNMKDLVNQVWKDCRDAADGRKIELKIGDLPQAFGDRGLMREVLTNLLSNAIKFTGLQENAVIEIGGSEEEKENIYYINDNGAGFDMLYSDKLFGVFQRLHGADEFEGTGVGLAIVQQIIHRHGGRVWGEGRINEGATFYFSLPSMHPQYKVASREELDCARLDHFSW